jgi:hypothetical protein
MWTVAAAMTMGCQEEGLPHFGTLQYESESFEVWASEGLEACGGTFEYTEQWLVAFRERIGEHGDPAKHTFYWLSPNDYDESFCPSGTSGCAYESIAYSTVIPHDHELVHIELDAVPPSFLREGAAEAFGSIRTSELTTITDIEALFDMDQIPASGYQTAGRFSRFIIDHHGVDAYFDLYEALDGATSRAALEAEVEDVLGVTLPELVADFESFSWCSVDRWRFYDRECTMLPLTPWQSPTRWAEEIDLSCAAPDVVGPQRDRVWTRRAFEVEQAGLYDLVIESADPTAQVEVFSCAASCFAGEPYSPMPSAEVATGGRASFFLDTGRHWLQVQHAAEGDASVSVAIER